MLSGRPEAIAEARVLTDDDARCHLSACSSLTIFTTNGSLVLAEQSKLPAKGPRSWISHVSVIAAIPRYCRLPKDSMARWSDSGGQFYLLALWFIL